jgi:uncharacterized membrane protein YraQ (UPF0718 family)
MFMDIFTLGFYVVTIVLTLISIIKNKKRTFNAMKKSRGMMGNMLGEIIAIIFVIGLLLTFIPPAMIKSALGSTNTLLSTVIGAVIGSVTLIPAFVAFPLVGSFVDAGASIVPAVAFLTTLTMVGLVTFPLEKKEFGLKFTVARNALSFIFAMIIAIAMGVIL